MKILYVANFSYFDGYSRWARDYVDLMIEMGYQVDCIDLAGGKSIHKWGEKWKNRIGKKLKKRYNICIIHKPPLDEDLACGSPFMVARDLCDKLVWFTTWESDRWPIEWKKILGAANCVGTLSKWQVQAAASVHNNVHLTPHYIDTELNLCAYEDEYRFYSEFSGLSRRKGLDTLLYAYIAGFSSNDNVTLKIKIPYHDHDIHKFMEVLNYTKRCFSFKEDEYPRIDVCNSFLDDRQMEDLMNKCHTYVCPAKGEGFSIPLATALLKGKNGLCVRAHGEDNGSGDDITWADGFLEFGYFAGRMASVNTDEYAVRGIKTDISKAFWIEPDVSDLIHKMKQSYEKKDIGSESHRAFALRSLSKEKIIESLKAILND